MEYFCENATCPVRWRFPLIPARHSVGIASHQGWVFPAHEAPPIILPGPDVGVY